MVAFLTVLHVLICILLVISILLQSSKGGGLAGMFGGAGASNVFGGRGAASFLSKVTMWLGISFAITSMSIAVARAKTIQAPKSALEQVQEQSPADVLPTTQSNADLLPPTVEPNAPVGE